MNIESMSEQYKLVEEEVKNFPAKLSAEDFDNTGVMIIHQDGSFLHLRYAFLREFRDDWVLVFCEHMQPMYFHMDDLKYWGRVK